MSRVNRTDDERLVIAFNIRKKTESKGMKSLECAKALNVTHSQWSAWYNGKRTPLDTRLEDIAKFFDCAVEDLFAPPPDWETEKANILKKQAFKKHKKALRENPGQAASAEWIDDDKDDDGTDYYLAIVGTLAKVQAKFNKGMMTKAEYSKQMKFISEFINFSYRDVLQ